MLRGMWLGSRDGIDYVVGEVVWIGILGQLL